MMLRYEQLFLAIAYGDAKGLPYETMTRDEIANLGGVASHLIAPDTYTDFKDFQGAPVGTWSDDLQHAQAMGESLLLKRGLDLRSLSRNLYNKMQESDLGWGGATKEAIQNAPYYKKISELEQLGSPKASGCGPLMRLAPLALHGYYGSYFGTNGNKSDRYLDFVRQSTTLTHNSSESVVSALTHYRVLRNHIMYRDPKPVDTACEAAKELEHQFGAKPILTNKLNLLREADDTDVISDIVYDSNKEAFSAQSVQTAVYATLDRIPAANQTLNSVVDRVIAEGGDTDSTAAIAASMWVMQNMLQPQLPDDSTRLKNHVQLHKLGRAFAEDLDKYMTSPTG